MEAAPKLSTRHRKILIRVFQHPTPLIKWNEILALAKALGINVSQRSGSRVAFHVRGAVLILHRPHPGNELNKPSVRDFRAFLERVGFHL